MDAANQNQYQAPPQPGRNELEQLLRRFRSKGDLYRYMDRNLVSLAAKVDS